MADFIIDFSGELDLDKAAGWLSDRPYLNEAPILRREYPWGRLLLQGPPFDRLQPIERETKAGKAIFFAMGWPVALQSDGNPAPGPSPLERLADQCESDKIVERYNDWTGSFLFGVCDDSGASILTDRLGAIPFYEHTPEGRPRSLGSMVDPLDWFDPQGAPFSLESLFDSLIYLGSFPVTTRKNIREKRWATLHRYSWSGHEITTEAVECWRHQEPTRWLSTREAQARFREALPKAVRCLTQYERRPVFTLSGGLDSRALIACAPKDVVERSAAVTFMGIENRETECARRAAKALGIEHILVRRDPEFYAKVTDTAQGMIGIEQNPDGAHYLCMLDEDIDYSVLIGGLFGDVFLRGFTVRYGNLIAWIVSRRILPAKLAYKLRIGSGRWEYRCSLMNSPHSESVEARRDARLGAIQALWPRTWHLSLNLMPVGHMDQACIKTSTRLMPCGEAFMHRDLIDLSFSMSPYQKNSQSVVLPVYKEFMGPAWDIPDANNGMPPSVSVWKRHKDRARARKDPSVALTPELEECPETPWERVQDSWVDWRKLQMKSPVWDSYRRKILNDATTMEFMEEAFQGSAADLLSGEPDANDPLFYMRLIRIGKYLVENQINWKDAI